jgi:hypothetical protein
MEITSGFKWVSSRKSGKWEIVKERNTEDVSLLPSTPPSSEAGSVREGPSRGAEGGGAGARGNNNGVGNSDKPSLPPIPTCNHPQDSSSSSDSSKAPEGVV